MPDRDHDRRTDAAETGRETEREQPGVRLGMWLSSEEHDPRVLVALAAAAESAGVTAAMISDHLRPWVPSQGHSPHVWTVLGGISQATERIEIGTGVTALVHRNDPIEIAHAAATAAVMFDGRFVLGVGTGERLNEQPFGRRWPRGAERRERLRAAVDLIRRLCAGERVSARSEHWSVERLELATVPPQPPPIFVASSGRKSARLAGEIGDGLIGVAPDASLVDVFRGAGGGGRRCVAQLRVSLAATDDEAAAQAWRWWPVGVVPPALLGELATPGEFASVADAIGPDGICDTLVCCTDTAPIVTAVDRFVAAGFDTVHLHQVGPDQQRLVDALRSDLLPHYG